MYLLVIESHYTVLLIYLPGPDITGLLPERPLIRHAQFEGVAAYLHDIIK